MPQVTVRNGVHVMGYSANDSAFMSTKAGDSSTTVPSLFQRMRTRTSEIMANPSKFVGKKITVCGWARTVRSAGKGAFAFLELNDGAFKGLQVIVTKGETEGFEEVLKAGGTGSSYRILGTVVESQGKGQAVELRAEKAVVLGTVDAKVYPMAKKAHSVEFMRSVAHLRPRSNLIGAVSRVRNACAFATHAVFQPKGFLVRPHTAHHGERLRGRRRDVPGDDSA